MINESNYGMENSILPDTSLVMAFRLKGLVLDKAQRGRNTLPKLVFSGLRNQPRIIHYAPDTCALLVNFREGGAATFFDMPFHPFFGENVELESLVSPFELEEVSQQLFEAQTDSIRIDVVEKFLLSRIRERKPDKLILASVQKIKQAGGNIRVGQLLSDFYISKDPFEKRFRQTIGATPKQYTRIIRLRTSIANYSQSKSITEMALEAGYYDQAHFTNDFKLFTGQTPLHFFRSKGF